MNIFYWDFNFNFSSWKVELYEFDEFDIIYLFIRFRSVFEIGCNDGCFFEELCKCGVMVFVGVELNLVLSEIV